MKEAESEQPVGALFYHFIYVETRENVFFIIWDLFLNMSLFSFSHLAQLTQRQATTTITQQNNTTSPFKRAAYTIGHLLIYPHGTSNNPITSHHIIDTFILTELLQYHHV